MFDVNRPPVKLMVFLLTHALSPPWFQAKFTVKKSEEEGDASRDAYIIECQGIAMTNPHL